MIVEKRPIDIYFDSYAKSHRDSTNQFINYFVTPLTIFSLLGLFWAIPFPYLKFLGHWNGFFNWASFLMAFSIYFYFKLSPVLSYLMLFVFLGLSYGVMGLDQWQKAGGPPLGPLCLIIFILCRVATFIGYRYEGKNPPLAEDIKFLLIAPVWFLHFVVKKFSIKY